MIRIRFGTETKFSVHFWGRGSDFRRTQSKSDCQVQWFSRRRLFMRPLSFGLGNDIFIPWDFP